MIVSNILTKIQSEPKRYGCDFWSYRIAGNVLELTVKPTHTNSPEGYREAVIKAGGVLEAIDRLVFASGHTVQIRSFPDIENPQLVALVRLHRAEHAEKPRKLAPINNTDDNRNSTLILLKSIASHYGLFFNNHNGEEKEVIDELMVKGRQSTDPEESYFSICSMMDNPFVWIKTGQWVERVCQLVEENPSIPLPSIEYRMNNGQRLDLNRAFTDCSYIQAVVQLQKPSFSNHP